MPPGHDNAPSFPRPGPLGRGVRLAKALTLSFWLLWLAPWRSSSDVRLDLAALSTWLLILVVLYLVPLQTRMTFGRRWNRLAVRGSVLAALLLLAFLDLSRNGAFWGSLASSTLYWSAIVSLAITDLSLIVASIVAAPG